ncbi:MAG: hypothetical protein LBV08_05835 [Clostridiales bacterium]|jgi:hypothetical protein|nr:hypothetical protein [Clostridiales bacterium]
MEMPTINRETNALMAAASEPAKISVPSALASSAVTAKVDLRDVINVPSVTISSRTLGPNIIEAAIASALTIARSQVGPEYIVLFEMGDYRPGELWGAFSVRNIPQNNYSFVADPQRSRYIVVKTDSSADKELAKINVLNIACPSRDSSSLSDSKKSSFMIEEALSIARSQVAPLYTVTFQTKDYLPDKLWGAFTVTSLLNPTDTAADANGWVRYIELISADTELKKIDILSITVSASVPEYGIMNAAIEASVMKALSQVDPKYTVAFKKQDYLPGKLWGGFLVMNKINLIDVAMDANGWVRYIELKSDSSAAKELAKINILSLAIPSMFFSLLTDTLIIDLAIAYALEAARRQVSPSYKVTFEKKDYLPRKLWGAFTVTSSIDPNDTAKDANGWVRYIELNNQ